MGAINGVRFTGTAVPSDTGDTYPVIDPIFGIDGWRGVADAAARNAIPDPRRRQGMIVYQIDTGVLRQLKAAPWTGTDNDWDIVAFGGDSPIQVINLDTTLDATQSTILVNAAGGNVVVTLPLASSATAGGKGRKYAIKRVDTSANLVTIARSGADTLFVTDSVTSFNLSSGESVVVQADGADTRWVSLSLETQYRTGTGAPSNTLGINGDHYLDISNGDLYKKVAGVWVLIFTAAGFVAQGQSTGILIASIGTLTQLPALAASNGKIYCSPNNADVQEITPGIPNLRTITPMPSNGRASVYIPWMDRVIVLTPANKGYSVIRPSDGVIESSVLFSPVPSFGPDQSSEFAIDVVNQEVWLCTSFSVYKVNPATGVILLKDETGSLVTGGSSQVGASLYLPATQTGAAQNRAYVAYQQNGGLGELLVIRSSDLGLVARIATPNLPTFPRATYNPNNNRIYVGGSGLLYEINPGTNAITNTFTGMSGEVGCFFNSTLKSVLAPNGSEIWRINQFGVVVQKIFTSLTNLRRGVFDPNSNRYLVGNNVGSTQLLTT